MSSRFTRCGRNENNLTFDGQHISYGVAYQRTQLCPVRGKQEVTVGGEVIGHRLKRPIGFDVLPVGALPFRQHPHKEEVGVVAAGRLALCGPVMKLARRFAQPPEVVTAVAEQCVRSG